MTCAADPPGHVAGPRLAPPPPLRGLALAVAALRSLSTYVGVSLYVLLVGPAAVLGARLSGRSDHIYTLAHGGVALAQALSGIACRVGGLDRLPRNRPAVFCANHTSNVDAPLLFHRLHPRLHMLYKVEFGRMPVLGVAARLAGFIPVERDNPDQSQAAVDQAALAVARGASFLVFPEGTRSRTGDLLPFKKGGFIMAIKAQAPLVPVAVLGGREAMTKGSRIIRPVTVRVRVGHPIDTSGMTLDDRDRLIAAARAQIEELLSAAAGPA